MDTDQAMVESWLADLRSGDAGRRLAAAQAIAEQKRYTPPLVSALQQIARADHFAVRQAADRALAALSTDGLVVRPEPLPPAQAAPVRVAVPAARARPPAQAPARVTALRPSTSRKTFFLVAAGSLVVNVVLAPILFSMTLSPGSLEVLAVADIIMALLALAGRRYDVAAGIVAGIMMVGLCAWLLVYAWVHSPYGLIY
jgi:hypothetical protein